MLTGLRYLLISILLIAPLTNYGAGYDYTPAIVNLKKSQQPDSIGFNLVSSLNRYFYQKVINGSVTLWSSSKRELEISPENLQKLEKEHQISFAENEDLFLNEVWKLYKKKFEFHIIGFSFFARNSKGELYNMGFIYAEDVMHLLQSNLIPTDANGVSNLTYSQALNSKVYPFRLVKFGNLDLTSDPLKAVELMAQAFHHPKNVPNVYCLERQKDCQIKITATLETSSTQYQLFQALEKYYSENKHEVYNKFDKDDVHLNPEFPILVEAIRVIERWRKTDEGKVKRELISLSPIVSGVELDAISNLELQNMNMVVSFRPFIEVYAEGDFDYTLEKINSQEINKREAEKYKNKLHSTAWNHLND